MRLLGECLFTRYRGQEGGAAVQSPCESLQSHSIAKSAVFTSRQHCPLGCRAALPSVWGHGAAAWGGAEGSEGWGELQPRALPPGSALSPQRCPRAPRPTPRGHRLSAGGQRRDGGGEDMQPLLPPPSPVDPNPNPCTDEPSADEPTPARFHGIRVSRPPAFLPPRHVCALHPPTPQ